MHRIHCFILPILIVTFASIGAFADTLHVPGDYPDIRSAVQAAQNGDEVVVADGVWSGAGNRTIDTLGKQITIRSESDDPAQCVIDCGGGRAFLVASGETETTVIRGFTMRNARQALEIRNSRPKFENCVITDSSTVSVGNGGAGVIWQGARPAFTGCQFIGNTALGRGGAFYCHGNSYPSFADCTFADNRATGHGGAVAADAASATFVSCTFEGNRSNSTGGAIYIISSGAITTLLDCVLLDNIASQAAAVYQQAGVLEIDGVVATGNRAASGPSYIFYLNSVSSFVSDTVIKGNSASGIFAFRGSVALEHVTFEGNSGRDGGGVHLSGVALAQIENCKFLGNIATNVGGGLLSVGNNAPQVRNCVFSGNEAGSGAGIYTLSENMSIANCTLNGNTASNSGGGVRADNGSPAIRNAIVWNNSPDQLHHAGGPGAFQVSYCNIQGGHAGTGNMNEDPLFVDPDGADDVLGTADDNYRLQRTSPCIDAGASAFLEYERSANSWKNAKPDAEKYAFDEVWPGIPDRSGCLADSPAEMQLDGGLMTINGYDGSGNHECAVIDGASWAAVSDGDLIGAGAKLIFEFDEPISSFYTYYGSLQQGRTITMRVYYQDTLLATLVSAPSPHDAFATGHGFISDGPIDRIEFIDNGDRASVVGAFAGLAAGEQSLGIVNIPGYQGPDGPNVQLDFGVEFWSNNTDRDLGGDPRAVDGDGDGIIVIDMGAYEYQPPTSNTAALTDFEILDGTLISGGLAQMEQSDNTYLTIEARVTGEAHQPHLMRLLLGAESPREPSEIDLLIESFITDVEASGWLFLRDWDANQWEQVAAFTARSTESVFEVTVTDAARFVNDSDGRIELEIKEIVYLPFTLNGFHASFDQVLMTVR